MKQTEFEDTKDELHYWCKRLKMAQYGGSANTRELCLKHIKQLQEELGIEEEEI